MNLYDATILTDKLREIRSLIESLGPLLDEGKDEYKEFIEEFDGIFSQISPHYTLALTGTVSSGKSTLLSSLLKEVEKDRHKKLHPISSCSPSNETFSPLLLKYGDNPYLIIHYFEQEIIDRIKNSLKGVVKKGKDAYLVELYGDLLKKLSKIPQVRAGIGPRGVVERMDLENYDNRRIRNILKDKIARSSEKVYVYGIYKVELAYPGEVLKRLNNIHFIDLFGFGDPNPIIEKKYTRFASEVQIDMVVYIFPNMAITDHFHKLFELPNFIDDILGNNRFIIVLNQVDSYPDKNRNWQTIKDSFKKQLSQQVPILKPFLSQIPIFIMSALSIDDPSFDAGKGIRKKSIEELHRLRDEILVFSNNLTSIAKSPMYFLQPLFELLSLLELLLETAKLEIHEIEENIPNFKKLINILSLHHKDLEIKKKDRLTGFQTSLKDELSQRLSCIDYIEYYKAYEKEFPPPTGNPKELFRWMVNASQSICRIIGKNDLVVCLKHIIQFSHIISRSAYQEYVDLQDQETVKLINKNMYNSYLKYGNIRPFYTTLDNYSKSFVDSSGKLIMQVFLRVYNRFINWYLSECGVMMDAQPDLSFIMEQVITNIQKANEAFMSVYIYGDPESSVSYKSRISEAGELTLWEYLEAHIDNIEDMLSTEVRIVNTRIGCHIDRKYFVSNREEYSKIVENLLRLKDESEELIVKNA